MQSYLYKTVLYEYAYKPRVIQRCKGFWVFWQVWKKAFTEYFFQQGKYDFAHVDNYISMVISVRY
jgi:transposase